VMRGGSLRRGCSEEGVDRAGEEEEGEEEGEEDEPEAAHGACGAAADTCSGRRRHGTRCALRAPPWPRSRPPTRLADRRTRLFTAPSETTSRASFAGPVKRTKGRCLAT